MTIPPIETAPPMGFRGNDHVDFVNFVDTVKLPFSDKGFSNFSFVADLFDGSNTLRRVSVFGKEVRVPFHVIGKIQ